MGQALNAVDTLLEFPSRHPSTSGGVVGLVVLAYIANLVSLHIPLVGLLAGPILFGFGLAAMYGVINAEMDNELTNIIETAINTVNTSWISVAGGVAFITASLFTLIIGIGFVAAIVFMIVGLIGGAGLGIATAGFLLLGGVAALFGAAMFLQFIIPAIVIEDKELMDAVNTALEIVKEQPVSVAGFTGIRMSLEYLPGLLLASVPLTILGSSLSENPEAVDSASQFAIAGGGTGLVITVFLVASVGVALGQFLRVAYTTAYFKQVREETVDDTIPAEA